MYRAAPTLGGSRAGSLSLVTAAPAVVPTYHPLSASRREGRGCPRRETALKRSRPCFSRVVAHLRPSWGHTPGRGGARGRISNLLDLAEGPIYASRPMYLPLSKKPRKTNRKNSSRLKAKLAAKNNRRRQGLKK